MKTRVGILRVLLLVVVPLLGLMLLAWGLIQTQQEERDLAAGISAGTMLFERISDVVTHLQRERGKSGLFLERSFSEAKLLEQRQETVQACRQLERQVTLGAYPNTLVLSVLEKIKSLAIPRDEILGRQWKANQTFDFFTQLIREFLLLEKDILFQSRRGELDQALCSLLWLEAFREQAGRLRARISRILADDQPLSRDELGLILGSSFVPSAFFDVMHLILQPAVLQNLEERKRKPEWELTRQTMKDMVQLANVGSYSMDPNRFFEAMTAVVDDIDSLIKSELRHMRELETESYLEAGARIRRVKNLVWLVLACLLIMGVFSWRRLAAEQEALREIQALSRQKELILGAAGEGIFGLNVEGTFSFANPSALAMLGFTSAEMIGHDSHALVHHHRKDGSPYPSSECPILRTWRDGELQRRDDEVFWRKDGTPLEVEYVSTPIRDESGMNGAVIVFTDVSVRRMLEKNLRQALKDLEVAQEQENQIGFQIQEALLFGHPPQGMPDLNIARLAIPARGVDGDFFNFITLDDHHLDILVGDVMGKGIPAALVGAAAKSHFQLALARLSRLGQRHGFPAPGVVVAQVSREMYKPLSDVNRFVCLHYGRIDRKNRRLSLVNCGHTPLIHYRAAEKSCDLVFPPNAPMGIEDCDVFPETLVPYEPGDLLVFFSDGITEARNAERQFFGSDRLVELIRTNAHAGAEKLVGLINLEVLQFIGHTPVCDDLTCIVIESLSGNVGNQS